ncbi:nucleoid-associated protein [Pseudomonas resinovorans]|uniref:Nucleoid-associated protein n=1 Tax=Metapseudomonas resinovorans TaxID=53412 RepID=A0ABT4Y6T7_METRE|nr:nucleoid-associated protein [Pseudomonas resinovorans]MDA8484593.1 nucleoid-associated protein [Pseudomonas resinovorans]
MEDTNTHHHEPPEASQATAKEEPQEKIQTKLEIYNAVIQKIDIKEKHPGLPFVDVKDNDIYNYLSGIIRDIVENHKGQKFKFNENLTDIPKKLNALLSEDFEKSAGDIAKKLLETENSTQEQYKGFVELREGSLLCAHIEISDERFLLLVKIDHAGFLHEKTYIKTTGLPEKQRAQKSATIKILDNNKLDNTLIISDTNAKITEYWWQDFLDLLPLSSPENNTLEAFTCLEAFLSKKLKKDHPSDYWTLRNAVVSYFTTKSNCIFDEMIDSIFKEYEPDSEEIDLKKTIKEAKELPKKHNFDSQFSIVSTVIKAKIKRQIRLVENLELRITGEIKNFKKTLETGIDDGRKFLKIYSDDGYDAFRKDTE